MAPIPVRRRWGRSDQFDPATSALGAKRGMWGGQHKRWQKMAKIPVVSASIHLGNWGSVTPCCCAECRWRYSGCSPVSLHFLSQKRLQARDEGEGRKESPDLMVMLCAPQGTHKVFLNLFFFKATRCSGSKHKFDLVVP